jgi:sulfide:quinone oxidoreductase
MSLSRRTLLKLGATGLLGAVVIERSYDYLSESKARGKIVIVGGGAAGITIAAYLSERLRHDDITLIEPAEIHRYQPGYTLIAAGLLDAPDVERPTASLIPRDVKWVQDRVMELNPDRNQLTTAKHGVIAYDFLVVVPGCEMDFSQIGGISQATLGEGNVHCIYDLRGAQNEKTLMKPKVFGDRLAAIYAERKIAVHYVHRLASVDTRAKQAVFLRLPEPSSSPLRPDAKAEKVVVDFDFLHFVPPMSAPDFIRNSPLTSAEERPKGGWVTVDKATLVHTRYKNILSLGDVAGTPASKTGAAIRMQAPVAAANLIALMEGKAPPLKYNGYSACPIITEYGKVLMCEFGYDEKLLPTIPFLDPAVERGMWWTLKVHGLMPMYYHGMLKGLV